MCTCAGHVLQYIKKSPLCEAVLPQLSKKPPRAAIGPFNWPKSLNYGRTIKSERTVGAERFGETVEIAVESADRPTILEPLVHTASEGTDCRIGRWGALYRP